MVTVLLFETVTIASVEKSTAGDVRINTSFLQLCGLNPSNREQCAT